MVCSSVVVVVGTALVVVVVVVGTAVGNDKTLSSKSQ